MICMVTINIANWILWNVIFSTKDPSTSFIKLNITLQTKNFKQITNSGDIQKKGKREKRALLTRYEISNEINKKKKRE